MTRPASQTPETANTSKDDLRLILGLETSCDETAAAIVREDGHILSNVVYSQLDDHRLFGGVVPEIAARAHISLIDGLIQEALQDANVRPQDISAVAATAGPGLIGGVLVGLITGKALASAWSVPLIGVNHLEGHALTPRLTDQVPFPYVLLLVSGGHTQILLVEDVGKYQRLGTTVDDAVGEAFDKTAKILKLGYPGGPEVQKWAKNGDPDRFPLPRPMIGKPGCHMSFSGLKTAVRRHAEALHDSSGPGADSTGPSISDQDKADQDKADLCASFQHTVAHVIEKRLSRGIQMAQDASTRPLTALVTAGGVAANTAIRETLQRCAEEVNLPCIIPPAQLCTDNGAMIAWAGVERLKRGMIDDLTLPARARWPLDSDAPPAPGAGVKA